MPTIYFVRHGKAAAGFGAHPDPGLDELGRSQSQATAKRLGELPQMPVYSSPLARAQETARPLCELWQCDYLIEPRVAEIPSPTDDLAERQAWLAAAMTGSWTALDNELIAWRDNLAACLLEYDTDVVLFSHYVAINAAVGKAQGDDRMVVFHPDNASVTTLTNDGGRLAVETLGGQAATLVN